MVGGAMEDPWQAEAGRRHGGVSRPRAWAAGRSLDEMSGDENEEEETREDGERQEEEQEWRRPSTQRWSWKSASWWHDGWKGRQWDKGTEDEKGDRSNDIPPEYDGTPGDYEKWRRMVKLWMLDTKCPARKLGLRVLRSLKGNAATACENLDPEALSEVGGEKLVFEALEAGCAEEKEASMQKKFDDVMEAPNRKHGQAMIEYINDYENKIMRLESVLGEKMNDSLTGYMLMKRAGLSDKEKTQVLTVTGLSWSRNLIKKALKGQFGNIHKRTHFNADKPKKVFAAEAEDDGEDHDHDDGDHGHGHEEEPLDLQDLELDEEEIEEAMATYLQARQALKQKDKDRGYHERGKKGGGSVMTRES